LTKTAVALYHTLSEAVDAVRDLKQVGFEPDQISLVTTDVANGMGRVGSLPPGDGDLVVGMGTLAVPGVGEVMVGGPLVAALAGARGGTGDLVDALVGTGIPEKDANAYAEGVRRGSSLVSVTAPAADVDRAVTVLERFNPTNLDRLIEEWHGEGWQHFDRYGQPHRGQRSEQLAGRTGSSGGSTTGAAR